MQVLVIRAVTDIQTQTQAESIGPEILKELKARLPADFYVDEIRDGTTDECAKRRANRAPSPAP